MKDLGVQTRVTAFLRNSLAEGAQEVLKLEAIARKEGLLGERHRITQAHVEQRGCFGPQMPLIRISQRGSGGTT